MEMDPLKRDETRQQQQPGAEELKLKTDNMINTIDCYSSIENLTRTHNYKAFKISYLRKFFY